MWCCLIKFVLIISDLGIVFIIVLIKMVSFELVGIRWFECFFLWVFFLVKVMLRRVKSFVFVKKFKEEGIIFVFFIEFWISL